MRIVTLTCPDCGTITAGNVLETHREMQCVGLNCDSVVRFADLDERDRTEMRARRRTDAGGAE